MGEPSEGAARVSRCRAGGRDRASQGGCLAPKIRRDGQLRRSPAPASIRRESLLLTVGVATTGGASCHVTCAAGTDPDQLPGSSRAGSPREAVANSGAGVEDRACRGHSATGGQHAPASPRVPASGPHGPSAPAQRRRTRPPGRPVVRRRHRGRAARSGGLSECARASDAAVPPILGALQEVARVLPGRRDAGAFLQLAADLAERTGRTIDLPTEFRELASQKSSSMVAKAARRLLEV